MALAPGTKLGPYEILSPLGAGGMGEVYRARDARLDREVAIKVLPEALAQDKERILRFEREAKVLASLNHPNIAAVYGFEEYEGKRFLVMELAEGETLADRLDRGPIPIQDALEFATGIAVALEVAHEKGIIHRDLKPANVKVASDGKVKVLDFGLAKAMTGDATGTDISNSPTITVKHTRSGVILGTAAYMSPEQSRGRLLDKRTDIWSFGVTLFECLAGRRPFEGETTSDLVARILEREPDWSMLPHSTPPLIQLLLRRCLVKDRNRRLRDIGDARVDIESSLADPTSSGLLLASSVLASQSRRPKRRAGFTIVALVIAVLIGIISGWMWRGTHEAPAALPITRFTVELPPQYTLQLFDGSDLSPFTLNRAGTVLAFTAADAEGINRLLVQDFSTPEARPIPGTEGGHNPFFSPDGRWLGFFRGGKLVKVPTGGGPALTLCDATTSEAVWLDDGTIILKTTNGTSLVRVSERGGTPKVLAEAGPARRTPDGQQLLLGFQTLHAVPGANYILAAVWDGTTIEDYATISVSLSDGAIRPVIRNAVDLRYVAPGYLVFLRGSSLLAAPFDPRKGVVTGEPMQVIDGVVSSKWADQALFAVSTSGTLAYVPGGREGPGRRLIRVDPTGKKTPLADATDAIVGGIRVSPNGREVAIATLRRNMDLWNVNLERRSMTLVNNVGESWNPVWTPDGQYLVFWQTVPEKSRALVRKRADGGGELEPIPLDAAPEFAPTSFSPDGQLLMITLSEYSAERRGDIVVQHWGQVGPWEVLLGSAANETHGRFATDGRHFAYTSDETGRDEVFVRTLADNGFKWQVSQAGGYQPEWSRDGKKLFFLDYKGGMYSASVDWSDPPRISTPQKLFDLAGIATADLWGVYDVLPDDSFVMVEPAEWEKQALRIHIVLNWQEELKNKASIGSR